MFYWCPLDHGSTVVFWCSTFWRCTAKKEPTMMLINEGAIVSGWRVHNHFLWWRFEYFIIGRDFVCHWMWLFLSILTTPLPSFYLQLISMEESVDWCGTNKELKLKKSLVKCSAILLAWCSSLPSLFLSRFAVICWLIFTVTQQKKLFTVGAGLFCPVPADFVMLRKNLKRVKWWRCEVKKSVKQLKLLTVHSRI